ncbi:MAG: S8/S53 family peptidase [Promethearchaeota archaeon]
MEKQHLQNFYPNIEPNVPLGLLGTTATSLRGNLGETLGEPKQRHYPPHFLDLLDGTRDDTYTFPVLESSSPISLVVVDDFEVGNHGKMVLGFMNGTTHGVLENVSPICFPLQTLRLGSLVARLVDIYKNADSKPTIVNLSLGIPFQSKLLQRLFWLLETRNVLSIVSSPTFYKHALSVGVVDLDDVPITAKSDADIYAYGSNVEGVDPDGYSVYYSGVSVSIALTSSVAFQIWSLEPTLMVSEVKQYLIAESMLDVNHGINVLRIPNSREFVSNALQLSPKIRREIYDSNSFEMDLSLVTTKWRLVIENDEGDNLVVEFPFVREETTTYPLLVTSSKFGLEFDSNTIYFYDNKVLVQSLEFTTPTSVMMEATENPIICNIKPQTFDSTQDVEIQDDCHLRSKFQCTNSNRCVYYEFLTRCATRHFCDFPSRQACNMYSNTNACEWSNKKCLSKL